MNTPDGRYARRAWSPPLRWTYAGPGATHEEILTQQALDAAAQPGADLVEMVRPPLPQIRLFPEKYGYTRGALRVDDIVNLDRRYKDVRVSWFSGGPASFSGAPRNAQEGSW